MSKFIPVRITERIVDSVTDIKLIEGEKVVVSNTDETTGITTYNEYVGVSEGNAVVAKPLNGETNIINSISIDNVPLEIKDKEVNISLTDSVKNINIDGTTISGIKDTLDNLGKNVSTISETIGGVNDTGDTIKGTLATHTAAISTIEDTLGLSKSGDQEGESSLNVLDRLDAIEEEIGVVYGEGNISSDSRLDTIEKNLGNSDDKGTIFSRISDIEGQIGTGTGTTEDTILNRIRTNEGDIDTIKKTVGIGEPSGGDLSMSEILNKIPVTSGDKEKISLVGFNDKRSYGDDNPSDINTAIGVDSIAIGTGNTAGSYGFNVLSIGKFENIKTSGTASDVKHKSVVNNITIDRDLSELFNQYENYTFQCAMRLSLFVISDAYITYDGNNIKYTGNYKPEYIENVAPQQYFERKISNITRDVDNNRCTITFSEDIVLDIDDDKVLVFDIDSPFNNSNMSPSDINTKFDYETNCFRLIRIYNDTNTIMFNDKPVVDYLKDSATRYPGSSSVSLGECTYALSKNAFAEGYGNIAYGSHSHVEGYGNEAAYCTHAEGKGTKALGNQAHTEGLMSIARGSSSHAEGQETEAAEQQSHAEGLRTKALNKRAHAEGDSTKASGLASHAEGVLSSAEGESSHAEGYNTKAIGNKAHAEGNETEALGSASHSEGLWTTALVDQTHAEGLRTTAMGKRSHAEGHSNNIAADKGITANTVIADIVSIWSDMGTNNRFSLAKGTASHSEGEDTLALANRAHAEGQETIASGPHAHAEGYSTKATKDQAHAEGYNTTASGDKSHAEGSGTTASGSYSHAAGLGTIAKNEAQTVVGRYNADVDNSLFIVGSGSSSKSRSNAFVVNTDGRATISKEPVNDMDVVNKKYLEKTMSEYFESKLETFLINESF